MFEEQDNESRESVMLRPFTLGILLWLFISAAIGVLGCVLLFNDCGLYKELLCTFVVVAILFKPILRLSLKMKN